MPNRFVHLAVDAADPPVIGRFWSDLLGWPVTFEDPDETCLEGPELGIVFVPVPEPKTVKNRLHLDLAQQPGLVDRAVDLGARPADIRQGDVPHAVLKDPEGNEFCVYEDPREKFVANTGAVAAMVFDVADPHPLAPFWSAAMGWPVVETRPHLVFLRAPSGTGPWLALLKSDDPKQGKNRLHLDTAPLAGEDHAAEVAKLIDLGARPADVGQGDVPWTVLEDPQGNEFCVLTPR
ncbi:MAG TPA: VOC family protein [Actinophytocola sp.]|uniref:VOC family protein n=1 Tax=Actinophytocola sp. TaxID=1872138 RepID=UPI002E05620F|nr:VOC family protein [Actinophytocola sp.]